MSRQHDDRRLEAVLAQYAHRFTPVEVGKADVHDYEINLGGFGGLHPLAAAIDRDRLEFFMQGKLLDHRVAQFGIIVHDQDLAGIRHGRHLRKLPIIQ